MADEHRFLFQTDPGRFKELLATDSSEARAKGLGSFEDILLCEILRYSLYNLPEMAPPLMEMYRKGALKLTEDLRNIIYRHVAGFVSEAGFSIAAFLPFIMEDAARSIVSTAVIDYVSFGPLTDNDPMSRVKDVIGMIENENLENVGAAFGGLLYLGDARVCELLVPLRDTLDPEAVRTVTNCYTGFMHAATVDFYLDWLEGMDGTDEDGHFGLVASGLHLIKYRCIDDQVSTGQRPFPASKATPEQWKKLSKRISLDAYLKQAAPRMYALEQSEPPPRVMPHVLATWGLKPRTDPSETADLGDRGTAPTVIVD